MRIFTMVSAALSAMTILSFQMTAEAHKSSAGFTFSHKYEAAVEVNKPTEVVLSIKHNKSDGDVSVTLNAPDNLTLGATNVDTTQAVSGPGVIDIPISVTALEGGFHVIGVLVEWTSGTGRNRVAAYSIPVQTTQQAVTRKSTVRGGFVELPARETTE